MSWILVSTASFNCYPNNSLSSFTIFLPEQIHLKGEWEVAISEILYPSLYQNVTEGKFTFVDGRESPEEKRKIQPMHVEPGLYPSIVDIVVAMNDKVRKRIGAQKFEYNGIYVSVDKITKKVAIHLLEDQSVFIIQSADLSHIFGCDLEQNQTCVIMKGKGSHYPQYSYDIIRVHSLMIYSDIIEYNIVGDTKTPLLRCISFISKVKNGDIISTGQYVNYQSFTNLQFENLLKNSFHSIKIELRDTTGEKIPFVSVEITRVVLLFRKISDNHFRFILHMKWLLKVQLIFLFFVDMQGSVEEVLVLLHKLLGELQFPSLKNI